MADERSFTRWTKESLIKRVLKLESELDFLKSSLTASGQEVPVQQSPVAASAKSTPKKKKKEVDPSKYTTRFIALKIAYLGKNYSGFEYQASGKEPSIEEELWKALVKACLIFPERPHEVDFSICEYSKCGRTDRGVSAFGQVVGIRVRSNRPARKRKTPPTEVGDVAAAAANGEVAGTEPEKEGEWPVSTAEEEAPYPVADELPYCRILNRLLPPDIRAIAWCPVPPPGFSARFSCRERQYRYFFTQPAFAPVPSSIDRPPVEGALKEGWLDIEAMRQAAQAFVGEHDFRNFCKVDPNKQITNFVRRMFEVDVVEVRDVDSVLPYLGLPDFKPASMPDGQYPKVYSFNVRGTAFLWHQIRHMIAVLFLVGQGLEKPSIVSELLDVAENPRKPSYLMAEEVPLVLWDCIFPEEGDLEERRDALGWVYVGDDGAQNLHGSCGLAEDVWQYWRERKMDEILSNRLLDYVTSRTGGGASRKAVEPSPSSSADTNSKKKGQPSNQKLYQGGVAARSGGRYIPVMQKPLMPSVEEINDKFAQRKGFASSDAMRSVGNWRSAIRDMKEKGKADDAMEE
ncbi:uncharacterized protein E0L32_010471 [Thyridium curvatum]|uniref:Pseudouridine synthase I TruA alpha/beta domain-containing protein n=1 Tax=Thyridium curvatum TaxID=1093900 RepID=A0A507AMT1_9PEZI|nr:uncharacterized protein E0L32_010471 [Thyridium curvatum]TPX07896.1 hypothetical protein E0L32_010471 [Thyridium curvatum]